MNPFKLFVAILLAFVLLLSCKSGTTQSVKPAIKEKLNYKYSLGQWSYNKELFAGTMSTFDFIDKTKELGFDGVDFVNQFFRDKANDLPFLDSIKASLRLNKLEPAMIMIDLSEDLGNPNAEKRKISIAKHKEWISAANYIGCKIIRVNAFGIGTADEVFDACLASITELADYAKKYNISILIENHGGHSSDANWLVNLIDRLEGKNVYLLPDFDNWCMERENGARWGEPCIKEYDRYQGMNQLMPYAKSISIKSFGFNADGSEIKTDYKKMFQIVQDHKFNNYMGIEFEGEEMDPTEGIQRTLKLVHSIIEN